MPLNHSPITGLVRRVLAYFAVAFAFLALCALLAFLTIRTGKRLPMLWVELAAFTWITFWYPIQQYKRHWRRPIFWSGVVGLLAIHLIIFVIVLRSYPEWRLVWFIPVAIAEGGGIFLALGSLFGYASPEPRHHAHKRARSG